MRQAEIFIGRARPAHRRRRRAGVPSRRYARYRPLLAMRIPLAAPDKWRRRS